MKSSRREFIARLTQGMAGTAIGSAIVTGCGKNTDQGEENPYAYDLSRLKRVDPALMLYRENTPIHFGNLDISAIAFTCDDHLLAAGSAVIVQYDAVGKEVGRFAVASPVRAIAADENGGLFLAMEDHVEVWSAEGEFLQIWESLDRQALITSIIVAEKSVFVADAGNKRVYRYNTNGAFIGSIQPPPPGFIIPNLFFNLAVDPEGSVWVVNPGKHQVVKINPGGSLSNGWGKPSHRIEGFSGCCNPTHLATLQNGDFVTSEKGLPRVKVYDRAGTFKGVVAGPEQFIDNVTGLDLATDSTGMIYVLDPMKKQIRRFQLKEELA